MQQECRKGKEPAKGGRNHVSKRRLAITKSEPACADMQANSLGARTYGDYCRALAAHIGKSAKVVEEVKHGQLFCHVERTA